MIAKIAETNNKKLPNLLYVGDVPIESSYHGSVLIFRLLQNYPTEKLLIVEAGSEVSQSERRLPGVSYIFAQHPGGRWLRTRFNRVVASLYSLVATFRLRVIESAVGSFTPEAVLTVAHGYSWITAAAYARKHKLPLHFIVHDDWPMLAPMSQLGKIFLDSQFKKAYQQAKTRFCISPSMEREYCKRYGVAGRVMYPSRSSDVIKHTTPPQRLLNKTSDLKVGFAGTINAGNEVKMLIKLTECLRSMGGALHLFGPITKTDAKRVGLDTENSEIRGMFSSVELSRILREEMDVLYIPISFDNKSPQFAAFSFPSKLTDYTLVGIPLLLQGPDYSSAVRWAQDNPGVAVTLMTQNINEIKESLIRLSNSEIRWNYGSKALEIGDKYFSFENAKNIFYSAISQ